MAFSEIEQARVSKRLSEYCNARIPVHVRHELRLGFRIEGHAVVLFEERPAYRPPHDWQELPVAKFRYVRTRNTWQLYCQHRDLRWHTYDRMASARTLDRLLREVDSDPTGIFFG
jgi:hypothetical protein